MSRLTVVMDADAPAMALELPPATCIPLNAAHVPMEDYRQRVWAQKLDTNRGIYFLLARSAGLVKIGWSEQIDDRIARIQLMSPVRLELLGAIAGDLSVERQFHRRLIHFRAHGEWFSYCEPVRAVIAESMRTGTPPPKR